MNDSEIPRVCDILVMGGGPAGSSVAALLAQAGFDVVLLEKALHPRPQVGESLIPHFWKYTDLTGASALIEREKFVAKAGGIAVWNGKIHRIAFSEFGFSRPALHVERDVFDALLLNHALASGSRVYQQVAAKTVNFSNSETPIVNYQDRRGAGMEEGSIACRYVIDASGSGTLLAGQFASKRLIDSRRRFLSLWGYFRDSRFVGIDGKSYAHSDIGAIKPVTFVTSFKEGWIWHIAMRQLTSVGLILHTERARGMNKREREDFFLETCRTTPYLDALLDSADYQEDLYCERPDYSYYSTRICGDNFYMLGDAASFVDPIYSHGVLNAFYNAAMVAFAVQESMRDPVRRSRHAQLCENRMRQFYSFSRALALGDFSGDGVDTTLVKHLMRSVPQRELDLMLAASYISERAENFHRLMEDADLQHTALPDKIHVLTRLEL